MEKIITKLGLKAGARAVFDKALQELLISFYEILDILPLHFWSDKEALDEICCLICRELEKKGVTITDINPPLVDASKFSIINYFPFDLLPANQIAATQKLVGSLNQSSCDKLILLDNGDIILVASGGICVEQIDPDGKINRIKYFEAGDYFQATPDFRVFVSTRCAFFWKFPQKNISAFPTLVSKFLTYISEKELDNLYWISAKTELNSTRRHKLSCSCVDKKFPREHIYQTSDFERSCIANFTRETITRRKNKPAQKRP